MPEIRRLSPSMVNKIAAGEVIERPASVVKELVENALDAGATRIEIVIEKAGNDLIAVIDNGGGIEPEQLILAVTPHATSKVCDTDDLFAIRSFGFRGEALASIAEISQMLLKSRATDQTGGAILRSDGGEFTGPTPIGMGVGTTVEVRNLFFNTPVRRKYLKSATTEFGHIAEGVVRLAIPNPEVHFLLRHNDRIVYDLPPCEKVSERLGRIFGGEISDRLIPIDYRREGFRIFGGVAHPDLSRSNLSMQYLFLNRRFIRDKSLQHALAQGYRGLMTVGRYPVAFLELELPPDRVDVNVHPSKLEVRFLDSQAIYAGFLSAIREEFLRADLRSQPTGGMPHERGGAQANTSAGRSPTGFGTAGIPLGFDTERAEAKRREWLNFSGNSAGTVPAFRPFSDGSSRLPGEYRGNRDNAGGEPVAKIDDFSPKPIAVRGDSHEVVQIHEKYLVIQTPEGMGVIDQHALHEKILYEKIRREFLAGPLESQRLLVPETVDLGPKEAACALEHQKVLSDFGLHVAPFGGQTLLISAYPVLLESTPPREIFETLLGILIEKGNAAPEDLLDNMMHQMACKGAVKGGDPLRPDALAELLAQADGEERVEHCPHGRPSILNFTLAELDKMFKRT